MADMNVVVVTAAFSLASAALALTGKVIFDRSRPRTSTSVSNIESIVNTALVRHFGERDQIVFQTSMKIAVEGMNIAIDKLQNKTLDRMGIMTEAMTEAAAAIREVHGEIREHREAVAPAIRAAVDTSHKVNDIHRVVVRKPRSEL